MTFLTPLFLLGALAIALPVLYHLIRRTTRQRISFSSLMFLVPSPPRLTQRSRLENILLLLLRCLAICLLAFAFARPFIKKPLAAEPAGMTAQRLLLLLDTSASMRRADLWGDARKKAEAILRKASPADQVAIFTFDRRMRPVMSFDQWNAAAVSDRASLAARALADISPGWGSTHLAEALISSAETLADSSAKTPQSGPGHIIVITDFQEGSGLEPLQGFEWPKGIDVSLEIVKPRRASNAGLQLLADSENREPNAAAAVRVRVSNAADSKRERFQIAWAGPSAPSPQLSNSLQDVYVPAGQSRIILVPLPGPGTAVDRITLQGDDEDFDNTVFVIPPEAARSTVLYLGNDSEEDTKQPLYFLKRAFQQTRRQSVQVVPRRADAQTPLSSADAAQLFILTDPLPETSVQTLRDQITAGKTLLCAPKSSAVGPVLASIFGLPQFTLQEIQPPNYAMLAEIDFRHPLFSPFADPRFSDFTKIHFWKYRRFDPAAIPGSHILAKFDSGDPALVEIPVGRGRVFILASGWQPEDSQLAVSTKFVPLLYSLLEQSGATEPAPAQYFVGDALPLKSSSSSSSSSSSIAQTISLISPDGTTTPITGETTFTKTTIPGIYKILSGDSAPARAFAVNLDPRESRTAPLPADELEHMGAPASRQPAAVAQETQRKTRLQNAELESRQRLWRWCILGTLALVLIETWLAGRTARRNLQAAQAVA